MESKKLCVAIITNNYTPYSGGVVSSINAFANQLMAQGHTVWIVTLDFLGPRHDDPSHVIRIPSVAQFKHYKNHCAVPWRPRANMLELLRKLDPDVVHMQHPFLLCQSALKAARRLAIPVVFTYHTIYERYSHYVPFYQPLVEFAVITKVLRFCKKVDHIIAPSSAIKNYLVKNGVKTPIEVIPSPLQDRFLPARKTNWNKNRMGKFKLLLVSRLVKEKNIPFVLDIFFRLHLGLEKEVGKNPKKPKAKTGEPEKFVLTIVGYGEQEKFLREYAYKKLKLSSDQIKFIIKPPQDVLLKLYREADLFLFPSTSDTQGLVLAEAMAGGTPVVAVDGPGQRDIVKNGVNGFIVDSQQQMVQIIKQIAADHDLLEALKDGALKTATRYSPAVLTKRLLQVYLKW